MVIKKVNLDIVVGVTSTLPETSFPEVAFAGKSNVGKSSLINALMNRKSYARTSSQPGKTQTINNSTADYIRRGYPLSVYDEAVSNLLSIGIAPVVHMIIGLPHETISDYIATARYISDSGASGIKISLLHILKDTDLYNDYCKGLFKALTMDEYLAAIGAILPVLPKSMVIHRLTGDGPKNILAAPLWTADKKRVLNTLSHYLKENMIYQGKDL